LWVLGGLVAMAPKGAGFAATACCHSRTRGTNRPPISPPQVLRNPSVPFQEGRSVDAAMLSSRGVAPYGPPVDVWAAGVLAYELVVGRPPFEVEDEAQTAALIMYSDELRFPPSK
jgi:serine/threonine protein kinase